MPAVHDRSHSDSVRSWFQTFLRQELALYPGRWAIVARMAVATTAVALVCMTFRIPRAYQGAVYALLVSHEALENNWWAALRIAAGTLVTTALVLVTAVLFAGDPTLHFLWNVALLFLAFYCVTAMREYAAAVPVAVVIGVAITSWDRPLPAGMNVSDTLWLCLACLVGVVLTASVSTLFAASARRDILLQPLAERLALVEVVLNCLSTGIRVSDDIAGQLDAAVLAGTSAWRSTLRRSGCSSPNRDRLSATGALIARLLDIAASLPNVAPEGPDREQASQLAGIVETFRIALLRGHEAVKVDLTAFQNASLPIRQIAHTLELAANAWVHPVKDIAEGAESMPARVTVFVPGAFTNPDHLKFALKGCLAASLCYVFYSVVAWQGLNSAIASCMFTALSTVGASTQKLAIRFAGAIIGGVILGMGVQLFIFPRVDSIFAFTLVFGAVSTMAAWVMTCSPRLSYLGLQIALSFDLVHLQSFRFETSLAAARDRVAGVLLGLAAMWLVFDHLWSSTASVAMRRSLVRSLRLLAQLAREPVSKDRHEAIEQSVALRETAATTLDQTQSLSDGVLFEFGRHRAAALEFREQVRRLQPQLRSLFVMRVSALDYRLRLPGFELPAELVDGQRVFDESSAAILEELADEIETGVSRNSNQPLILGAAETGNADTHVALLRRMSSLITSIARQVDNDVQKAASAK